MSSQRILELEETTTEDWGFHALNSHGAPSLVEPYAELPQRPVSLFALANKSQLFVAAGGQGITLGSLDELRKATAESKSLTTATTVAFSEAVLYLEFTSDEKHLVIISDAGSMYVFSVESFVAGVTPVPIISVPVGDVKDIKANPYIGKELAILSQEGGLIIYNIETQSVSTVLLDGAKSFAWSPKGKQLVVGKDDGTLQQYTPTGDARASIPCPEELEQGYFALNITWLETHVFVVVYSAPQSPGEHEYSSYIVKREKAENIIKFSKIFEPCPPYGDDSRFGSFYVNVLKNWQQNMPYIILMASAPSTDISILTTEESFSLLDDNTRASLPMSEDDTSPVGMAIDISSTQQVSEPCKGVDECDPLPILWVLNNEGNICAWHIVSQQGIKQKTASLKPVYEQYLQNVEIASLDGSVSAEPAPVGNTTIATTASPFSSVDSSTSLDKPISFGFSLNDTAETSKSVPAPAFGSSGFGATPATAAPAFGSSGFGATPATAAPAFGSSGFGATPATAAPAFGSSGFGATPATAAPAFGSSGFGATPATAAPAFGSSGFGATPATAAPAFGSSGFGATPATAAPAYGSSGFGATLAAAAPAFGSSSFGATPATAAPAFGSSGFGATPATAAPAFGSSGFGAPPATTIPTFGSTKFGATPSFGSSGFSTLGSSESESPFAALNKPAEATKPLSTAASGDSPFANFNKSGDSPFANLNKSGESPFASLSKGSEKTADKVENPFSTPSVDTHIKKPSSEGNDNDNTTATRHAFGGGAPSSFISAFGAKSDNNNTAVKSSFSTANAGFQLGTLIESTSNVDIKPAQIEVSTKSVFSMGNLLPTDDSVGDKIEEIVEEPEIEEPKVEEPEVEEVKFEEPEVEEPTPEKPEVEEPTSEESTPEESTSENSEVKDEENEDFDEDEDWDDEEDFVEDHEESELDLETNLELAERPKKIVKKQNIIYTEPEIIYEIEEIIRPSEPKIIKKVEIKYAEPVVKYDTVEKIVVPSSAGIPEFIESNSEDVEMPVLSNNPIENEYLTLYQETESQFDLLNENAKSISEFIHDHKNIYHTSETMETNDFNILRLSEAHFVGDIFLNMLTKVTESLDDYKRCDSNIQQLSTAVEALEFKLPRILEIIKVRSDEENIHRLRYRSLPFEDAVIQKKLRNNLKSLDQTVREAESAILVLKSMIYRINQTSARKPGNATGAPSLEGIEESIQKISRMARRRADEINELGILFNELRMGDNNETSQLSIGNNATLNNSDVSFSLSINNTMNNSMGSNNTLTRLGALEEVDLISMGKERAFKSRVGGLFRCRDAAAVTHKFTF